MKKITVGILTISDRCAEGVTSDESGPNLVRMIQNGIIKNALVVETGIVSDEKTKIEIKLLEWTDKKKIDLILTTGGTGISPRDVTPEATTAVLHKTIPGISNLIFKHSSEVTPLAALSRGVSGVRNRSLIINLPGSKNASQECLEFVSSVIGHAVDLICDNKKDIAVVHSSVQSKRSKVQAVSEKDRKRKSQYPCIKVSAAQNFILQKVSKLRKVKVVDFKKALGYVLAKEVVADDDLPPFDASIMDGYAIICSDKSSPKRLIGSCAIGILPTFSVSPGSCVNINTGSAVPAGADAVVPIEHTFIFKNGSQELIGITTFPESGGNIRARGSDFKKGDTLIPAGTYLGSPALGLLAAAGVLSVCVFEKPVVAIFSTGDEVVDPHEALGPGKVRDSNRITLINLLNEEGFSAVDLGIVRDFPDALYTNLSKGFEVADIVVTTGSMSMGDRDYMKDVLITDFGAEICFGAVLMKPGKPTAFATLNFNEKPKFWFGLPGNPASAFVTTHLFLLPALRNISGSKNEFPPRVKVSLTFDITLEDRPHYHRAVLYYKDGELKVSTTGNQRSSRVGSCLDANCFLEIPQGSGKISSGSEVMALVYGKFFS